MDRVVTSVGELSVAEQDRRTAHDFKCLEAVLTRDVAAKNRWCSPPLAANKRVETQPVEARLYGRNFPLKRDDLLQAFFLFLLTRGTALIVL